MDGCLQRTECEMEVSVGASFERDTLNEPPGFCTCLLFGIAVVLNDSLIFHLQVCSIWPRHVSLLSAEEQRDRCGCGLTQQDLTYPHLSFSDLLAPATGITTSESTLDPSTSRRVHHSRVALHNHSWCHLHLTLRPTWQGSRFPSPLAARQRRPYPPLPSLAPHRAHRESRLRPRVRGKERHWERGQSTIMCLPHPYLSSDPRNRKPRQEHPLDHRLRSLAHHRSSVTQLTVDRPGARSPNKVHKTRHCNSRSMMTRHNS